MAEALEIWYTPENENYLLNMTHDKDSLVRVAAVDSLKIGRTLETLSRLEKLFTDSYYVIRGYAVTSHFNVWVNCFGYNVESMDNYRKKMRRYKESEKIKWVEASYEETAYIAGDQEGLQNLFHKIRTYTGDDYHVYSALVSSIQRLRNIWNAAWINKELENALNYICPCYLINEIPEYIKSIEDPRVLIIDNTNTGVSQLLEFLGIYLYNYDFYSAGFHPGSEINFELVKAVQDNYSINLNRYHYPKQMSRVWDRQFIVPIGVTIEDELFPYQKMIHTFESIGEETIAIEQGKEILNRLMDEICKECSREGIQVDSKSISIEN